MRTPRTDMSVVRAMLLMSGSGSNVGALVEATYSKPRRLFGFEPVVIVASRPCAGIERVKQLGFPSEHIHIVPKEGRTKRLLKLGEQYRPDIGQQLGWMPMTHRDVVFWFDDDGRIGMTNGHPVSLHPGHADFGGTGMHGEIAVEAWCRFAHATGRRVIEPTIQCVHPTKYDGGDLLDSCLVPIDAENDSVEDVQKRAGPAENLLTVKFACEVARTGRLSIEVRSEPLVQPHEMDAWRQARAEALAAHGINPND